MHKLITSTLVSAALGAAVLPAYAQMAGPPTDGSMSRHEHRPHHAQRPFSLPGERIEAKLAYLKTALKITQAQEAQWDAFANVLRKHAGEMDQRIKAWRTHGMERPQERKVTAIDRLQHRQVRLAAAAEKLNELLAVERPLYAALTPGQREVADQVLAPHHRGGFHHRGAFRAS